VISLGLTAWVTLSGGAKRAREHVQKLIGAPSTGATSSGAPPAAVAITAPTAAATGAAGSGDVFAQLEKLAQLQATGLLTADDVATKKAELLKQI
jgi:hypothetical protein